MIAFLTLLEREIKRFLKVIIQTLISPIISSFLYLLVFGVSLGASVTLKNGMPYLSFLIPGLMAMGLINNAFQNSSSSVVTSKFSGDLEDMRVVPITNSQIIFAMGLGGVIRGFLVAAVTGLVGTVFHYYKLGEPLYVQHPFWILFFILVGGLTFSFIGIFIAFIARTFDQLSAFSTFILLPLTYLGGVFVSIETLHPTWQAISKFNPLFYLINGFRYAIIGSSDVQLGTSIFVCLMGVVVTYIMARIALVKGSFSRW
ncbi:MAG: ABC transporter permease [Bdellovibrionales bacterium RIFCSPHIGHO2_01_FULL_40_29]|nr:MAG: ABC transporter permease [Bdellovibrionales bacterium RIFCSPHIGHO2_01_FULL_40_29]OFZ32998.1 MAG: ABC transporter permease [Bdellovibrionales bacterium RIFCSPHIGHO2_02_FULL_40_15]